MGGKGGENIGGIFLWGRGGMGGPEGHLRPSSRPLPAPSATGGRRLVCPEAIHSTFYLSTQLVIWDAPFVKSAEIDIRLDDIRGVIK